MNVGAGVGLIVGSSLVGALVVVALWRGLAPAVAMPSLAALGSALGAGALLVQDHASAAEWAITVVVLGLLTPLHARLVFGRPGPGR